MLPGSLGGQRAIFLLPSQDAGTFPVPWHMAQAAVGAHRFGTLGFAGHSNLPRPPHPGHGTLFSCDATLFIRKTQPAKLCPTRPL